MRDRRLLDRDNGVAIDGPVYVRVDLVTRGRLVDDTGHQRLGLEFEYNHRSLTCVISLDHSVQLVGEAAVDEALRLEALGRVEVGIPGSPVVGQDYVIDVHPFNRTLR